MLLQLADVVTTDPEVAQRVARGVEKVGVDLLELRGVQQLEIERLLQQPVDLGYQAFDQSWIDLVLHGTCRVDGVGVGVRGWRAG